MDSEHAYDEQIDEAWPYRLSGNCKLLSSCRLLISSGNEVRQLWPKSRSTRSVQLPISAGKQAKALFARFRRCKDAIAIIWTGKADTWLPLRSRSLIEVCQHKSGISVNLHAGDCPQRLLAVLRIRLPKSSDLFISDVLRAISCLMVGWSLTPSLHFSNRPFKHQAGQIKDLCIEPTFDVTHIFLWFTNCCLYKI